jgi:hypothetical protein
VGSDREGEGAGAILILIQSVCAGNRVPPVYDHWNV